MRNWDLAQRLRESAAKWDGGVSSYTQPWPSTLAREAADTIEIMAREIADLTSDSLVMRNRAHDLAVAEGADPNPHATVLKHRLVAALDASESLRYKLADLKAAYEGCCKDLETAEVTCAELDEELADLKAQHLLTQAEEMHRIVAAANGEDS